MGASVPLSRSASWMVIERSSWPNEIVRPTASLRPSGDQLPSIWLPVSEGTSSCAVPPLAGTTCSFTVAPGPSCANRMRVPSGDHCGSAAVIGGNVSCCLSEPSTRLLPQAAVGRHVGHPLAVVREAEALGVDPPEVRRALARAERAAHELAGAPPAVGEDPSPVARRHGPPVVERTLRESDRAWAPAESSQLERSGSSHRSVRSVARSEDVALPVRRPASAAGSGFEARQERVWVRAVRLDLPERHVLALGVAHGEPQPPAVGGPRRVAGVSLGARPDLARATAVAADEEDVPAHRVRDRPAVGGPGGVVDTQVADGPRRSAEHGDDPERAREPRSIRRSRGSRSRAARFRRARCPRGTDPAAARGSERFRRP